MGIPELSENQGWAARILHGASEIQRELDERELRERMPGTLDEWLRDEDIPGEIRSLLTEILHPEAASVLGTILAMGLGAAISVVISNYLGPVSEKLGQKARAAMPWSIVGPDILTRNSLWNFIVPDLYLERMLSHGLDAYQTRLMYEATRPRPAMGEMITAYIKTQGAQFPPDGSPTGYDWADEYFQLVRDASMTMVPFDRVVQLTAWGDMDDDEYKQVLKTLNLDDTMRQYGFGLVAKGLSPAEITRYSHLKGWDADALNDELRAALLHRRYRPMVNEIGWDRPDAVGYIQFVHRSGGPTGTQTERLNRLNWHPDFQDFASEMAWSVPSPTDVALFHHRQGHELSAYEPALARVGLHPAYAGMADELAYSIPAVEDVLTYLRRTESGPTEYAMLLHRLGVHPNWLDMYKTVTRPFPSVQDLILMAVREVFTPEVAERFGQFEEIPPEFIRHTKRAGLTEEWARNYWAAHWVLPGPQQGFEMLHRGIINDDDLARLFVALDVMPFWRQKLTSISYRVLTRVDARRMHRFDVLADEELYEVYRHQGYGDMNAQRMADFTIAYNRRMEIGYTRGQVSTAYKERRITRIEAADMLSDLGLRGEDIDFELERMDWELERDLQDDQVKLVQTGVVKGLIPVDDAGSILDSIGVSPERKTMLVAKWEVTIAAKQKGFTKAEIIRFYINGAIEDKTAEAELSNLGFSRARIRILLSDAAIEGKRVRGKREQLSRVDLHGLLTAKIINMQGYVLLLRDYGWRKPELSILVYETAQELNLTLPEGFAKCSPVTISGELSRL